MGVAEAAKQKATDQRQQYHLDPAKALIRTQFLDVADDPGVIVSEFRTRFYDTELFFDPFAKGKFANYLFRVHEEQVDEYTRDQAHTVTEEALLFIEAAYRCFDRLSPSMEIKA